MESNSFIKVEPFNDAHKFIDALRITNPSWSFHPKEDPGWMRGWYFRGQGDATWPLIPSVFRELPPDHSLSLVKTQMRQKKLTKSIEATLERAYKTKNLRIYDDQFFQREVELCFNAYCEYLLVKDFVEYADDLGHFVPSLDKYVYSEHFLSDYVEYLFDLSTSFQFWTTSSVVLAQHHRIPTRLLDWTYRPLVAAYFAAANVPKENENGYIAVYGLSYYLLELLRIKLIKPSRSLSPYLHAQAGLLTYHESTDYWYKTQGKYLSIEDVLQEEFSGRDFTSMAKIRKFILPVSQISELLRLLWLEGISIAHLMPNLDNVTEALKLKWRFAQPNK